MQKGAKGESATRTRLSPGENQGSQRSKAFFENLLPYMRAVIFVEVFHVYSSTYRTRVSVLLHWREAKQNIRTSA